MSTFSFIIVLFLFLIFYPSGHVFQIICSVVSIWIIYKLFINFKKNNNTNGNFDNDGYSYNAYGEKVYDNSQLIYKLKQEIFEANNKLMRLGFELSMKELYVCDADSELYWTISNLTTGERLSFTGKDEKVRQYCADLFLIISSPQKYQHIREVRKTLKFITPIKNKSEKSLSRLFFDFNFDYADILISKEVTSWRLRAKKGGRIYEFNNINELEDFSIKHENEKNAKKIELTNHTTKKSLALKNLKSKFDGQLIKKGRNIYADLTDDNRFLVIVLKNNRIES